MAILISKHIYWLFSIIFLIVSWFSFFIDQNIITAFFAYIGFFGCLNLHGISKVENMIIEEEFKHFKLEELEGNNEH